MTSRSSFYKLLLNSTRRNLWGLILSLIGFFFAGPVPLLMGLQMNMRMSPIARTEYYQRQLTEWLVQNPLPRTGLMLMAAICGVALFRYLHDRRQVDFYHAAPIRRETLFAVNFTVGPLLVLPAYALMRLISIGIAAVMAHGASIPWGGIGEAVLGDLVAFLVVYGVTILCTVLSGNTFIAVLLDLWALFSGAMVELLMIGYASTFYDTYATVYGVGDVLSMPGWRSSPPAALLQMAFDSEIDEIAVAATALYAAIGLAATALAFVLFRIRRSERAGKAIAFEPFMLPLKGYVCVVMSLTFGVVFLSLMGASYGWMSFGLVTGLILSHWLMEAIYGADFRAMFGHALTIPALGLIVAVIIGGMAFDVTGYDRWQPSAARIEGAWVSSFYANIDAEGVEYGQLPNFIGWSNFPQGAGVSEKAAALIAYCVSHTDDFDALADGVDSGEWERVMSMTINLRTGGSCKARQYRVPYSDELMALVLDLIYDEAYVRASSPAFNYLYELYETPIVQVLDMTPGSNDRVIELVGQDEVGGLVEALRADELALTPDEMNRQRPIAKAALGDVVNYGYTTDVNWPAAAAEGFETTYSASGIPTTAIRSFRELCIYSGYTHTLDYLKRFGYAPPALDTSDVEWVRIMDYRDRESTDKYSMKGELSEMMVYDPETIRALLENVCADELVWNGRFGKEFIRSVRVATREGEWVYPRGEVPEALFEQIFNAALSEDQPSVRKEVDDASGVVYSDAEWAL